MAKQKKYLMFLIIICLILLISISFAFFNYTRTGSTNTIRVGRISFSTRQTKTINLTNAFPISSSEIDNDTDNVDELTITIKGDTDYVGGVEYLVTTEDVHIYTSEGKQVPISLDLTINNLGTENDNYFIARNSKDTTMYKIMSVGIVVGEQQLLVGYIKPNSVSGTVEGVDGSITIKAYFDKDKIAITDTPEENIEWQEGRVVISTDEWNSLQNNGISFKVKIEANEGIWVGEPFYEVMKRSTVMDNINSTYVNNTTPGIDFSKHSGDTDQDEIIDNGKGIYTLAGTEDDPYPIMYYRGDVDNNLLFGGFCWQIVRTTNTGGIKLIYNGIPEKIENEIGATYNCGVTRTFQSIYSVPINLKSTGGYYYADDFEIIEIKGNGAIYRLKDGGNGIHKISIDEENAEDMISLISENYPYTCTFTTLEEPCERLIKVDGFLSGTRANAYTSPVISALNVGSNFNENGTSLYSAGYMNNKIYSDSQKIPTSNAYFGNSIEYGDFDNNGTNEYRLVDDGDGSVIRGKDNNHHYSCDSTSSTGTCTKVRYYYLNNYCIELENGEDVYDAIYKMTGNGTDEVKARAINQNYILNQNDSSIKIVIENWFKNNLTNELDETKSNYTKYIEDTTYCNDRSFKTVEGATNFQTYLNSGWNPNGGNITKMVGFGTLDRLYNNWLSSANTPSLSCPYVTDQFRVSNDKAKLKYPVGLLTGDEAILAGNVSASGDNSGYLFTGGAYWSMSPGVSASASTAGIVLGNGLSIGSGYLNIRPVISLKEGTSVVSGNGTSTNPYIIK